MFFSKPIVSLMPRKNPNCSATSFDDDAQWSDDDVWLSLNLDLELEPGPMRFAPHRDRSIRKQIRSLSSPERICFENLKRKWERKNPDLPFTNEMYLHFARCSPGKRPFHEKESWSVMKDFDHHYLSLTAEMLEMQLLTKTLFPVPGLKTEQGQNMFYMRPSRYFSKETPAEDIIDNLAYCMQTMTASEEACVNGIGFLAYMNDWKMENFNMNYCLHFMRMLQGRAIPVRVELFLIVNPPSWFGAIWKIMKPMLSTQFRRKVRMISENNLDKYLQKGFEEFLPDETALGKADTENLVHDFVTYRKHVE